MSPKRRRAGANNAVHATFNGAALRLLRLQRELSLEELSSMSGLSVSFLSMIESGTRSPSRTAEKAIGDALNIDVEELKMVPDAFERFFDAMADLKVDRKVAKLDALFEDLKFAWESTTKNSSNASIVVIPRREHRNATE